MRDAALLVIKRTVQRYIGHNLACALPYRPQRPHPGLPAQRRNSSPAVPLGQTPGPFFLRLEKPDILNGVLLWRFRRGNPAFVQLVNISIEALFPFLLHLITAFPCLAAVLYI
ncbi:hypothetical protein D3C73_1308030 [compost metagenome]